MDCVYFPDIFNITSVSHRTIDVFATISESLEVNFNSGTDFPRQQIHDIMHEMVNYRQKTDFQEINKLLYLLTEMVLGVVESHHIDNVSSGKSVGERIQNKFLKLVSSDNFQPIPTFDHVKTEEYYTDVDEMYKLMRTHKHLYKDMQRQQEICWSANSKVQTYELCLKTAEMSRNYMADKLSSAKLKERDDSIQFLQKTLNDKKERAAETAKTYQTLITKEKATRNAMRLIERNLLDDIKFNLIDRIQSGLVSMKYILASQTNKLYELLPIIDDFDCRLAAESLIEKISSKYQYNSPQEFHIANGFNAKLPDTRFVSCKAATQIPKEQPSEPHSEQTEEQRNNNNISYQDNQFKFLSNTYVKTKDLSEKPNECFVNITKGMIVKLKIATDESKVAFGWYKTNPWNQKRWGFFCKSADNMRT
ncbi:Hypothetical predicted protein [Mytilus galloprovincialis]|uniref:Uncharacterized protein n=1 Tax=Mytilus galloprovincialis TaxID=29158 RepID=A0A8B6G6M3_MYTGA|nr:Hypothetical predicted protein [Mytilus galloprovincialis]